METTGEMNWQLLIKMVSSSARSPAAFRFSLSFVENRPGSRKNWLRPATPGFRSTGVRWKSRKWRAREEGGRGGGFRSSSGGDAVSILFVHANYSSSVTLLEIEGTGTLHPSAASPPPPVNLSRSFRPLSPAFSLSFLHLDLLPCPRGFLMDPDYAALIPLPSSAPFTPCPLCYYSSPFYPARHEISLSPPEDFTKDFNFPATPAHRSRGNSSPGFQARKISTSIFPSILREISLRIKLSTH